MKLPIETREPHCWGTQTGGTWNPGESKSLSVANLGPPPGYHDQVEYGRRPLGMWRILVSLVRTDDADNATAELTWGAGADTQTLAGILLPMLAYVPGNAQVKVAPAAAVQGLLLAPVQVTPVHGYGRQRVFTIADATAGAVVLPPTAVTVQALNASTVTVQGAAAPLGVAAGARLEVAGLTTLNTGKVLVEHEL